jgi:8-amino-7-oxononanoate synthase
VVKAVQLAAAEFGVGAAASPLITGYSTAHAAAEAALAKWKGTEAAVLLPSGYQANHAAVDTIRRVGQLGRHSGTRFLIDKLAHASLIDAVMSAGSFRIFNHNDLEKLERLLGDAGKENLPHEPHIDVVVTESVFSMDGDTAPLRELVVLKKKHPFFLLLDEAHGSGVYGPHGAGYAGELGLADIVDAYVVTLSKSLGCAGGAICGTQKFCNAVVNFGRAYIYSTRVPPTTAAACEAAIGVMRDEPWRQQRLRALAQRVRARLPTRLPVGPGDSPIIPIVLGSETAAMEAAEALSQAGLLVMPIRPPTVARGTSRLRVTLSCDHSDAEIDQLLAALDALSMLPRS